MTGVAGAEEIEDGLTAPHHPLPTHSMNLACVACIS